MTDHPRELEFLIFLAFLPALRDPPFKKVDFVRGTSPVFPPWLSTVRRAHHVP
jgi:hypothetical protein